jgi:hypothetical protein
MTKALVGTRSGHPLPNPRASDVAVIHWPADEAVRHGLIALGRPRLLLVDPGVEPPEPVDQLEDWLRSPADPIDLMVRTQHLERRHNGEQHPIPHLDDDGLLRLGSTWIAITSVQVPVLALLLAQVDRVVPFAQIVQAYAAAGGSDHPTSVRTVLNRLSQRVARVGLELVSVRQRGVMLRVAEASPLV